jgi:flagellar protein FlbD
MVTVTRLDGTQVVVNAGHLLLVERTPDTVLVLTTGDRLMVRESVDQVVERVIEYRRMIGAQWTPAASAAVPDGASRAAPESES